ncbi:unnamed protein product [Ambrosiozyma monospora]|uniref:Unnamed protein product n=1 Tax=Ambrosiozyma monospora TaxID=43982 RepID=A0ACB5T5D4_AMBMO|nr:unnamed protein product [Ambrosiozyma monospora]
MKAPDSYMGVLLFDSRDPKKYPIKLSTDQKKLKSTTQQLIASLTPTPSPSQQQSSYSAVSNLFTSGPSAFKKDKEKEKDKDKDKDKEKDERDRDSDKEKEKDNTEKDLKNPTVSNPRILETFIHLFGLETSSPKDVNTLYKFYRFWCASLEGKMVTNKGYLKLRYPTSKSDEIELNGMDNWKNVMCYLDALLVSMFYSSSNFDFLLDSHVDESLSPDLQIEIEQLKVILRFIVSLLRAGEYIPFTIMKQLCIMLSSLGCDLTLSYTQQDSLQLYEFLAECLSLPLITIKLDIIHSGKLNVKDDLRLIEERALLISVPTSINYNSIAENGSGSESRSNSKADGKAAEPNQNNDDKNVTLKGTTTEGATNVSMNGGEDKKATSTNAKGPTTEIPTVSSSDLDEGSNRETLLPP